MFDCILNKTSLQFTIRDITVYVRAYASVCGASEQSEPKTVTTLEDGKVNIETVKLGDNCIVF
jgi:hypothetical protein